MDDVEREQKCKWRWDRYGNGDFRCRRHAPIVFANPKIDTGSSLIATVTAYPEALCPCGDFEPDPNSIRETEIPNA